MVASSSAGVLAAHTVSSSWDRVSVTAATTRSGRIPTATHSSAPGAPGLVGVAVSVMTAMILSTTDTSPDWSGPHSNTCSHISRGPIPCVRADSAGLRAFAPTRRVFS